MVADANVLKVVLAGSNDPAATCIRRLLEICCVLLMCPKLWNEALAATSLEGRPVSRTAFHGLLASLGPGKVVNHAAPSGRLFRLPRKTPREDEYLVHFALERRAHWLVSNDRALVQAIEAWIREQGTWCCMAHELLAMID